MRTILPKAALAIAIASTIGVTGAIGQVPRPVETKTKPAPNRPQAGGPNKYVVCLSRASEQRLLPGSEARKRFMQGCMR
jgi:hypothetical protein